MNDKKTTVAIVMATLALIGVLGVAIFGTHGKTIVQQILPGHLGGTTNYDDLSIQSLTRTGTTTSLGGFTSTVVTVPFNSASSTVAVACNPSYFSPTTGTYITSTTTVGRVIVTETPNATANLPHYLAVATTTGQFLNAQSVTGAISTPLGTSTGEAIIPAMNVYPTTTVYATNENYGTLNNTAMGNATSSTDRFGRTLTFISNTSSTSINNWVTGGGWNMATSTGGAHPIIFGNQCVAAVIGSTPGNNSALGTPTTTYWAPTGLLEVEFIR
jgi:hypothetical protein